MSAIPIRTRPGPMRAAWRAIRIAWVSLLIWWTEDYLRECAKDGLDESLSLDDFRGQLEELRCRLAALEASA